MTIKTQETTWKRDMIGAILKISILNIVVMLIIIFILSR